MNIRRLPGLICFFALVSVFYPAYSADNTTVQRVDAILPLNLKQYTAAINEEKKFDQMVKGSIRKASKDPLLYQAYSAKRAMRSNPNDLSANETLCDSYKRTGYHAAAAKQCRDTLKINPKSALAKTHIADLAFRQGKATEAEELLKDVLRDTPQYSQANLILAEIAKSRGQNTEAFNQVNQALQTNPNASSLLAMGDLQMKSGQTDQATNTYLKVLQVDPKNSAALSNLANLFGGKGDYGRALDFAQQAAAADGNSALAQYTLGTQYQNNNRLEEAIVSYARAVQLDPNFAIAHRAMGEALLKKGSPIDALNALNKSLQLAPNDPVALAAQAKAYAATGNQDTANRIQNAISNQDFTKKPTTAAQTKSVQTPNAAPIQSDSAKAEKIKDYNIKARQAESSGKYELARQYYEKLAIEQPEQPDHFYNIARIYTTAQQWPLAQRFYTLALDLNPNHALSLIGLSRVQCYQGNAENARQNLSKAVASGYVDNNNETANYLGQTCPSSKTSHVQ